jgi:DGQHR domain-containing protein
MATQFPAMVLQDQPRIYLAVIPGTWLLKNTTPTWRIKQPKKGFQRMVTERRARQIAAAVLDQKRTFPNAIVLATDSGNLTYRNNQLIIARNIRFLVIDGQNRLWAQQYSNFEADYGCVIHINLSEAKMAELFVEINDTQKRVPSSLRWDLVKLVRPEDDPAAVRAVDLIERLNSEKDSPLFQRIDLTGEQPRILIKQASLAPALRTILNKKTRFRGEGFDVQLELIKKFFAAVKECDPDGWRMGEESPMYGNRIFRALIATLPKLVDGVNKAADKILAGDFFKVLRRIDLASISRDKLIATQGNAGVAAITRIIQGQLFR